MTMFAIQSSKRYLVYQDITNAGFYLTNGLKFGGDYLCYEHDPAECHSKYIVLVNMFVNQFGPNCRWNDLMLYVKGQVRLANDAGKISLFYENKDTNEWLDLEKLQMLLGEMYIVRSEQSVVESMRAFCIIYVGKEEQPTIS